MTRLLPSINISIYGWKLVACLSWYLMTLRKSNYFRPPIFMHGRMFIFVFLYSCISMYHAWVRVYFHPPICIYIYFHQFHLRIEQCYIRCPYLFRRNTNTFESIVVGRIPHKPWIHPCLLVHHWHKHTHTHTHTTIFMRLCIACNNNIIIIITKLLYHL